MSFMTNFATPQERERLKLESNRDRSRSAIIVAAGLVVFLSLGIVVVDRFFHVHFLLKTLLLGIAGFTLVMECVSWIDCTKKLKRLPPAGAAGN